VLQAVPIEPDETAAPEVVHHGDCVTAAQRDELRDGDLLGEAHDPEVARVDLHDEGRVPADGPLVVGKVGAVRGPHLAQHGAASLHHLGDAELAADFDELAPRHDGLPAPGKRAEHQQNRGGVVVDDQGILGPRELAEDAPDVVVAETPLAGGQVELQVGVAPAHLDDALQGLFAQGRAPQVRVQDDPRGVDHAPEAVLVEPLDPGRHGIGGGLDRERLAKVPRARQDPGPDRTHDLPDRPEDLLPGRAPQGAPFLERGKDLVDLGQALQEGSLSVVHGQPRSSVHVWLSTYGSIISIRLTLRSLFLRAVQKCPDARPPETTEVRKL